MEYRSRNSVFYLCLCALFVALSAVLSQLVLPIGPVPINMVHISIFTAAGLLGAKYGTLSQVVFVLMGAVGLPVFSYMSGGMGIIAGPTGGFIVGNVLCTLVVALIISKRGRSVPSLIIAMYAGYAVTYAFGIPWMMYVTGMELVPTLIFMASFLPGDALKVAVSVVLIRRLYTAIQRRVFV